MKLKTLIVFMVIIALVVAEVNAGKQKNGEKKGKKGGDKKGGKYDKKGKYNKEEMNTEGEHVEAMEVKGKKGDKKVKDANEVNAKDEPVVDDAQKIVVDEVKQKKSGKKVKNEEQVPVEEEIVKEKSRKKRSIEPEQNNCNCPPGPVGPPGPKGECIYQPTSEQPQLEQSIFISHDNGAVALHSQTTVIPECPLGRTKLWHGYSLAQINSNSHAIQMNLGKPDSCLAHFDVHLLTTCSIDGSCTESQRNDRSYWLMSNVSLGAEPLLAADAPELISRCAVCDIAGPVLAMHSQSAELPRCPVGWDILWYGYSYLASSNVNGDAGQLSQPGSCLREVKKPLMVQCNPAKGSCDVFDEQKDAWLKAFDSATDVSRCGVCVKVV